MSYKTKCTKCAQQVVIDYGANQENDEWMCYDCWREKKPNPLSDGFVYSNDDTLFQELRYITEQSYDELDGKEIDPIVRVMAEGKVPFEAEDFTCVYRRYEPGVSFGHLLNPTEISTIWRFEDSGYENFYYVYFSESSYGSRDSDHLLFDADESLLRLVLRTNFPPHVAEELKEHDEWGEFGQEKHLDHVYGYQLKYKPAYLKYFDENGCYKK